MVGKAMTAWKQFERLTAAIQALVYNGARVRWNSRIRGRQIDGEVRFGASADAPLLLVECKWRRAGKRVRVDAIEAFASKAKRLGASQAAFATNTGYQVGAIEAARELGVSIYTIDELCETWPLVIVSTIHQLVCNVYKLVAHTTSGIECRLPDDPSLLSALRFRVPGKPDAPLHVLIFGVVPEWKTLTEPYRFRLDLPPQCLMVYPGGDQTVGVEGVDMTIRARMVVRQIPGSPPPEIAPRRIRYRDALSQGERGIADTDVPIGFDSKLEAGEFYRNVWGLEYLCENISGTDLTMVLLPTNRQHGSAFSARFVMDATFADRYEQIVDANERRRLEAAYAEFKTYPLRSVEGGQAFALLSEGAAIMPIAAK